MAHTGACPSPLCPDPRHTGDYDTFAQEPDLHLWHVSSTVFTNTSPSVEQLPPGP